MSEERKKVLEMLAEGKITAEEAAKLLDKLSASPSAQTKNEEASSFANSSSAPASKPRFLRIVVDKAGRDQANVRIPLSFARTAPMLLAVLPTRIREKLAEQGIDLSECCTIDPKDWATALETMNIDVDHGDGKKVRVFCE